MSYWYRLSPCLDKLLFVIHDILHLSFVRYSCVQSLDVCSFLPMCSTLQQSNKINGWDSNINQTLNQISWFWILIKVLKTRSPKKHVQKFPHTVVNRMKFQVSEVVFIFVHSEQHKKQLHYCIWLPQSKIAWNPKNARKSYMCVWLYFVYSVSSILTGNTKLFFIHSAQHTNPISLILWEWWEY
jgi:hypothetical protein